MTGGKAVKFAPAEIEGMAEYLMTELKMTPQQARRKLSEQGVRWRYQFDGRVTQGLKERLRRLRQRGCGLCRECQADHYPLGAPTQVCWNCLEKKWAA